MNPLIIPLPQNLLSKVARLLKSNDLPTDDIDNPEIKFFSAMHGKLLVGVIGLEKYKNICLLRSLAVVEEYKNRGIGKRLVHYFFNWCEKNNLEQIFLLTTTAEKYFVTYGFESISRDQVPEEIKGTSQFKDICPASAVVMKKNID